MNNNPNKLPPGSLSPKPKCYQDYLKEYREKGFRNIKDELGMEPINDTLPTHYFKKR